MARGSGGGNISGTGTGTSSSGAALTSSLASAQAAAYDDLYRRHRLHSTSHVPSRASASTATTTTTTCKRSGSSGSGSGGGDRFTTVVDHAHERDFDDDDDDDDDDADGGRNGDSDDDAKSANWAVAPTLLAADGQLPVQPRPPSAAVPAPTPPVRSSSASSTGLSSWRASSSTSSTRGGGSNISPLIAALSVVGTGGDAASGGPPRRHTADCNAEFDRLAARSGSSRHRKSAPPLPPSSSASSGAGVLPPPGPARRTSPLARIAESSPNGAATGDADDVGGSGADGWDAGGVSIEAALARFDAALAAKEEAAVRANSNSSDLGGGALSGLSDGAGALSSSVESSSRSIGGQYYYTESDESSRLFGSSSDEDLVTAGAGGCDCADGGTGECDKPTCRRTRRRARAELLHMPERRSTDSTTDSTDGDSDSLLTSLGEGNVHSSKLSDENDNNAQQEREKETTKHRNDDRKQRSKKKKKKLRKKKAKKAPGAVGMRRTRAASDVQGKKKKSRQCGAGLDRSRSPSSSPTAKESLKAVSASPKRHVHANSRARSSPGMAMRTNRAPASDPTTRRRRGAALVGAATMVTSETAEEPAVPKSSPPRAKATAKREAYLQGCDDRRDSFDSAVGSSRSSQVGDTGEGDSLSASERLVGAPSHSNSQTHSSSPRCEAASSLVGAMVTAVDRGRSSSRDGGSGVGAAGGGDDSQESGMDSAPTPAATPQIKHEPDNNDLDEMSSLSVGDNEQGAGGNEQNEAYTSEGVQSLRSQYQRTTTFEELLPKPALSLSQSLSTQSSTSGRPHSRASMTSTASLTSPRAPTAAAQQPQASAGFIAAPEREYRRAESERRKKKKKTHRKSAAEAETGHDPSSEMMSKTWDGSASILSMVPPNDE